MIDWLSPLNFRISQSDIFDRHVDGTGKWFIDSDEFVNWRDGDSARVLWCEGGRELCIFTRHAISHVVQREPGRPCYRM